MAAAWKAQGEVYKFLLFSAITYGVGSEIELAMASLTYAVSSEVADLTSAELGEIIGWGTGQSAEAVQQTIDAASALTDGVEQNAEQRVTKAWLEKQVPAYSQAIIKGGDKLKNTQLVARKELMEKIISLWK